MAEALIFPLVRGVVGKAGDALVKRVTRMWGVDDDRDRLERRLAYVQSLLADAEVKSETNHAVRTWMKALKAAAYQADDVLDDFQYEALRLEAQSRGSKASKVLRHFTSQNPLVFRHKASRELKSVLDKIDELVKEMIVVTSRSRLVASIMGTLPPHDLEILSEDDSWELFSKKAFINKGVQEQTNFVSIGKRIVKKCKGLPLALKTMGGLMSSKQLVQEWEAIADINISDTSRSKDEVMSILKLSYTHLSYEMKQCFAFCAVFPKDYEMNMEILIQLWMANGFITEDGTMDLADTGDFIFNELAWRSFLQDVNVKQFDRYGEIGCKMHDLMHDLARYVTDEYSSAEELNQEKESVKDVRHMLLSSNELTEIGGLLKGASSLRTLGPIKSQRS